MISDNNQIIKLTIEYDGTEFCGWQYQPSVRTVQGSIEAAFLKLYGQTVRIYGAGRTDSGVHALGQVAHCYVSDKYPLEVIYKAVNHFLPKDVRIKNIQQVDQRFDARRSAVIRIYEYVISRTPKAVGRQYAWYTRQKFSIQPMKDASQLLLGEHDFSSFCREGDEFGSCMSRIYNVLWFDDGDIVRFEIHAVRYLRNMIRILIGTLLEVGYGQLTIDEFFSIFIAKDRSLAGKTAPPCGLFLKEIIY